VSHAKTAADFLFTRNLQTRFYAPILAVPAASRRLLSAENLSRIFLVTVCRLEGIGTETTELHYRRDLFGRVPVDVASEPSVGLVQTLHLSALKPSVRRNPRASRIHRQRILCEHV